MADTDVSNLSDFDKALMIENYGGAVDTQFAAVSFMRQYVKVEPVVGTDTKTKHRMGKTSIQKLQEGKTPAPIPTGWGKVSLSVDTVIIARDQVTLLNDFQTHINKQVELGNDHGRTMGEFFDEAFAIMAIKGAQQAAPTFDNNNGAFGAGISFELGAVGDELDADRVYEGIVDKILVEMEERKIPLDEMVVLVRPKTYNTLTKHNKLINKDYSSGEGDFAKRTLPTIGDVRIVKTTAIPTAPKVGHLLSNAANGNAYDVTARDASAIAVVLHPKGLFAGETIPIQHDIHFDKQNKTWLVDSWMSFAVTVDRPDCCGALFKKI